MKGRAKSKANLRLEDMGRDKGATMPSSQIAAVPDAECNP